MNARIADPQPMGRRGVDRYTPLRESRLALRGGRLLLVLAGILVVPLVTTGYVALTVLLFLPVVGLRMMFPRPVHVFGPPTAGQRAPSYGCGYRCDAATTRA